MLPCMSFAVVKSNKILKMVLTRSFFVYTDKLFRVICSSLLYHWCAGPFRLFAVAIPHHYMQQIFAKVVHHFLLSIYLRAREYSSEIVIFTSFVLHYCHSYTLSTLLFVRCSVRYLINLRYICAPFIFLSVYSRAHEYSF